MTKLKKVASFCIDDNLYFGKVYYQLVNKYIIPEENPMRGTFSPALDDVVSVGGLIDSAIFYGLQDIEAHHYNCNDYNLVFISSDLPVHYLYEIRFETIECDDESLQKVIFIDVFASSTINNENIESDQWFEDNHFFGQIDFIVNNNEPNIKVYKKGASYYKYPVENSKVLNGNIFNNKFIVNEYGKDKIIEVKNNFKSYLLKNIDKLNIRYELKEAESFTIKSGFTFELTYNKNAPVQEFDVGFARINSSIGLIAEEAFIDTVSANAKIRLAEQLLHFVDDKKIINKVKKVTGKKLDPKVDYEYIISKEFIDDIVS